MSGHDYVRLWMPRHPMSNKGGILYEHRYVMSLKLGRLLDSHEIVHHINGNVKDNRAENLELVSPSQHTRKHHKREGIELVCANCGDIFRRDVRNVRTKIKRGQKDFYCSRSCGASNYGNHRSKNGVIAQLG